MKSFFAAFFPIIFVGLMFFWAANIVHPWPSYGCSVVEGKGVLNETYWTDQSGRECGHSWPVPDSTQWYAFHTNGFEFGHDFPDKQSAYKDVQWWCRQ